MTDNIVPAVETMNKMFLTGPFGAGKTTMAIQRLQWLLNRERIRGSQVLVLTPQRTLAHPYITALRRPDVPAGPPVQVTTVASLARRSVELYWPLFSNDAGFADATAEPVFLNLETSQYHMGPLVDAAMDAGEFQGVRLERNRIVSQILDNLNKAALNGFTIDEAYRRLEDATPPGENRAAALNALRSAQEISHAFRALCLQSNLVDYSLQIELFNQFVLREEWSRTHLLRSYRHLIFDNIEEDTFTAHRLVETWLPLLDSALLVADQDGGVRLFLGASPEGVDRLRVLCDRSIYVEGTYTMSPQMRRLEQLSRGLFAGSGQSPSETRSGPESPEPPTSSDAGAADIVTSAADSRGLTVPSLTFKFYPQMIEWVAAEVSRLVSEEGVPADEIVVLGPFMSDALRFSLQTSLHERGVPSTTHRPSRPLRNEPVSRTLLTLAALCHPSWQITPASADVATMLSASIQAADPVRASLLSSIAYRTRGGNPEMLAFEALRPSSRQRITYRVGEHYDRLREWILAYRAASAPDSLDHFWSRIFGEVLGQPGFGFHDDMDAARVAFQLVTAARNFRWAVEPSLSTPVAGEDPGAEFCRLVDAGAVGALYARGWEERENAVLIAPAYTFLMRNRSVDYQFWLDVGSSGWWARLYQPLTHPYVLSRTWPAGQPWTDLDEYKARQQSMRRLVLGLMRRANKGIVIGLSEYSESGYEQRGPLLMFINQLLARAAEPAAR